MTNTISILTTNRTKLCRQKAALKEEYERRAKKIDEEITAIDNALGVVEDAIKPFICPVCNGSGNGRKMDAAGQMEDCSCPACKGTGIKQS